MFQDQKRVDKTKELLRDLIMNNLSTVISDTVMSDTKVKFCFSSIFKDKEGVMQLSEYFYYVDLSFLPDEIKKEIESDH